MVFVKPKRFCTWARRKGKIKCVAAFAASWIYVHRKLHSCILCSSELQFLLYIVSGLTVKAL